MLPHRALNVLADLKKELLSREISSTMSAEVPAEASIPKDKPRQNRKKLGPQRVNAFQRGCQRREWFAPVW